MGSAIAHVLFRTGYAVVIHDTAAPTAIRRCMGFTDAFFECTCTLNGVDATRVNELDQLPSVIGAHRVVPVTSAALSELIARARPEVLVDARMRKRAQPETQLNLAPLTIGLGPNFTAGATTHLALETSWGPELGNVLRSGSPRPLAGEPRSYLGHGRDRFVYAKHDGLFRTDARIADHVDAGQLIASIDDHPIGAPLPGILRGITHDRVHVDANTKIIEIDPRNDPNTAFGIGERPQRIAESIRSIVRGFHDGTWLLTR